MNKKKFTVLLLSAPIGSGHRMAAEAIKEELETYENVEVVHGNVFSFFPKFIGDTFLCIYLWILKVCPWLYQMTYAWGNKESGSFWLKNLINKVLLFLGSGFLNRVKPDVVIATHATPAGIMSFYKEKYPEVFLGVVVTDFTVHKWWLSKNVDAYFVADERLVLKFPADYVVNAFGIPIRKAFTVDDSLQLRSELAWPKNEKVCLVMGGGDGLLPMEEIISSLDKCKLENLRIVAICGNNEKLKHKLEVQFACNTKVEIIGFTEKVPEYMKAADLIISKAGGLTSSEALASNLQLLIYKPLPGQERNNAIFLETYYGACVCSQTNELVFHVKELCNTQNIKNNNEYHGKFATERICKYIFDHLTT